jgi:hypothetical protein
MSYPFRLIAPSLTVDSESGRAPNPATIKRGRYQTRKDFAMLRRHLRLGPIVIVIAAIAVIVLLGISPRGMQTTAAAQATRTASPVASATATTTPSTGTPTATLPRPTPNGTPDPVVHFSGTPVAHFSVVPTLPPPPPRSPVPWTAHDAPGQARPSGGYHTPTGP